MIFDDVDGKEEGRNWGAEHCARDEVAEEVDDLSMLVETAWGARFPNLET